MKYLDEYRDGQSAKQLAHAIAQTVTRPWTIMEVCGGQTHTIVKYGLDRILPPDVELVHGPGCPVCVTSLEMIDRAHAIASRPDVTFCSFGDMLRVPGSRGDLLQLKSQGADVRIVYSPLDAVNLATSRPDRRVVFFAIGFETTAPPNAMAVWLARKRRLDNFSVLVSHVLVPPMLEAHPSITRQPRTRVPRAGSRLHRDGHRRLRADRPAPSCPDRRHRLRAAGPARWRPADRPPARSGSRRGREPVCPSRARRGQPDVASLDRRCLRGLRPRLARRRPDSRRAASGSARITAGLTPNVSSRWTSIATRESPLCISGQILRGLKKPHDCPAFGRQCTPQTPLGATMVSSEGACAAYFACGRHLEPGPARNPQTLEV